MPDRSDVIEQLYGIEDPELGMNIVDLGLVYGVAIRGESVEISISLTYPGCPFGPQFVERIEKAMQSVPGVKKATATIVWDPAWNQHMMAEETREELKFAGRIRS